MDFDETGKRTTSENVRRFETTLGIELPADYKSFLLQINGGYPSDDLEFNIGDNDSQSVLSHFYMLGRSNDDIISLEECIDDFVQTGRISQNYLPIADDAFGNQICLGICGGEYGQVFFWDHENNSQRMVKIANSFRSFCDNLTALE